MEAIPQFLAPRRAARVRLDTLTPAVLRCQDGSRVAGDLQVISAVGGMLRLPRVLDANICASLMFLSAGGPVLGKAEMLSPLSATEQAFRFVALDQKNRRNLQLGIQSQLNQVSPEERWIAKYRSALLNNPPPRRGVLKIVLTSVAFGMLGVAGVAYIFHSGLLK
jgi:hypothetical protein